MQSSQLWIRLCLYIFLVLHTHTHTHRAVTLYMSMDEDFEYILAMLFSTLPHTHKHTQILPVYVYAKCKHFGSYDSEKSELHSPLTDGAPCNIQVFWLGICCTSPHLWGGNRVPSSSSSRLIIIAISRSPAVGSATITFVTWRIDKIREMDSNPPR